MYCIDCDKEVETEAYNDKTDPPMLVCATCGQFVYDADKHKAKQEASE